LVAPSVTPVIKSIFCAAIETCSCPQRAGYGIWDSCRTQLNSRYYGISKSL
uniref:Uncharacterized protein n=1 Tax=Brugia timori TaxID=42155 RepID=A0A0R3QD14_9BILA